MKRVVAIVRPHSVERLFESLRTLPLEGPCVMYEVKGFGRQKSYLSEYGEGEYAAAFVSKVLLSFVIADAEIDRAVRMVIDKTRTGRIGDGKIFVLSAADATEFLI
ncbi:MAG: P-II family nitrogen regulator [Thermoguttaceae bacterium]